MWHVYIVECSDKSLYTGITTDVERRVSEHNLWDKWAKYTKYKRPVFLQYSEEQPDKSSASKREYEIKKFSRDQKLALIKKDSL